MAFLTSERRYRRGFLLGKFLPPHAGHVHLVRSALTRCDELTVLVCTRDDDPIPGELRARWMRELFPTARIVHVTDDVPSYPHESPDFWPIWTRLFRERCPETEVVFSSETYGDEIARRLTIDHVLVDLDRKQHPVSGTAVRADPLSHWAHIPEPVRPYFAQRVALLGPESVGKSTMTRLLAEHFDCDWVDEYGREYTESMGPRDVTPDDFERIAIGQVEREEEAARHCNGLLICDTDAVTTEAFAEITLGYSPPSVTALADEHRHALYLLLDTDAPWVDDGTRWYPSRRAEHMALIRRALERRGRDYVLIQGSDYDDRLRAAVAAVEQHLARNTRSVFAGNEQGNGKRNKLTRMSGKSGSVESA